MTSSQPPTFRFAPSPTGYLHLGHAYSALLNADLAKRLGGRLLLRIEDIDTSRSRAEFVNAIIEDLTWLGIQWDGSIIKQSDRFDIYGHAAAKLERLGLLYACGATRGDIASKLLVGSANHPRDPDGAPVYRPVCTFDVRRSRCGKGSGPVAKRIDIARALDHAGSQRDAPLAFAQWTPEPETVEAITARPERWGDAVIIRKDTPASYHLASVVDDDAQGVTHVVRGLDIAPSTDLHALLQRLLALPPPVYHHHELILGNDGEKLSKSNDARPIRQMRAEGATPDRVREIVGLPPACA